MRKSTFRGDLGRKRVLRMRKSAYLTYCLFYEVILTDELNKIQEKRTHAMGY